MVDITMGTFSKTFGVCGGFISSSKPIIDYIAKALPNAVVNIMTQYRPEYIAYDYKDIARSLTPEEILQVTNYAENRGIHLI